MSTGHRLIDRVAFAALLPSLAVPIIAIALAAWRMGHLNDAQLPVHPGIGVNYFAAMMTLSATLFSMTMNTVLAVRNHASLVDRSIPWRRVWAHYFVALVVAIWAFEFSAVELGMEGWGFGAALVVGSVTSLAIVTSGRKGQTRLESVGLGSRMKGLLAAYPVVVGGTLAITIAGLAPPIDPAIAGVALLGFLGLPWSGVTVLFWLPAAVFFGGHMGEALPWIFLVLAAAPAAANAILAVVFLRSSDRRAHFLNGFLEVPLYSVAHRADSEE